MKKLLSIILLLSFAVAGFSQSQPQYLPKRKVLTITNPSSATWNGITLEGLKFGGLEYIPASASTKKCPIIIFLHGIGECGGTSSVSWDTTAQNGSGGVNDNGVDALYTTTPMSLVKDPGDPLVGRTFSPPNSSETFEFAFWAPQCWGVDGLPNGAYGFTSWPRPIVEEILKHIKTNLSDKIDITRIYLTGLSYGGGGANTAMNWANVRDQLAAVAINCPGYRSNESQVILALSGLPIWVCHANGDPQASVTLSDGIVDGLRALNPIYPVKYWRLGTATHFIWDWMYAPSNWTTTRSLSNGGTVNYDGDMNVYEWFLQFRNTTPTSSGRQPTITQTP